MKKGVGRARVTKKKTVGKKQWPWPYVGEQIDLGSHGKSKYGLMTALRGLLLGMINNLLSGTFLLNGDQPTGFSKEDCRKQVLYLQERYQANHQEFKTALENRLDWISKEIGLNGDGTINWSKVFEDKGGPRESFCKYLEWCRNAEMIKFTKKNIQKIYLYTDNFCCFNDIIEIFHL